MPPWLCSDPADGRSMRGCLDGNASSFQTERVNPSPFRGRSFTNKRVHTPQCGAKHKPN